MGVPVPYSGMASDTTDGSKTVKLHGKEAMLRNKSYFKRSIGDEAATMARKAVLPLFGQFGGELKLRIRLWLSWVSSVSDSLRYEG